VLVEQASTPATRIAATRRMRIVGILESGHRLRRRRNTISVRARLA
jgi:hypothetical protein